MIKKPEPVAWGVPNSRITESQSFMQLLHSNEGAQYPDLLTGLVTTEQNEAYATERVREALELAAQEADDWAMQYVEVDSAPHRVGDAIRALITKE